MLPLFASKKNHIPLEEEAAKAPRGSYQLTRRRNSAHTEQNLKIMWHQEEISDSPDTNFVP